MDFNLTEFSFASNGDLKENIYQQNLFLTELKFNEWTSTLILFVIVTINNKDQNYTHENVYLLIHWSGNEVF